MDWIGSREEQQSFSAAEKNDGEDLLNGSELEEPWENPSTGLEAGPPPLLAGEVQTGEADSSPAAQNDSFEALAREKKLAKAEAAGIDTLKSRIKADEERLNNVEGCGVRRGLWVTTASAVRF